MEILQTCFAIRLALDQFEAIDMPFHWSCTVRQGQPRDNGRFVALDTARKGKPLGKCGRSHILEPPLQRFSRVPANHGQPLLHEHPCLGEHFIHLADALQPFPILGSEVFGAGNDPNDDLLRKSETLQDNYGKCNPP